MKIAPLILVVGPSGAGKDSLLDCARQRLSADARFHFARRIITRPADAGGEDHDHVSPEHFDTMERDGAFLLSWRAHGLAYGVLREVNDHRQAGTAVVVNVSREVVADARRDLAPVGVVVVTAPPEILAQRLAGRGRESADDIRLRLGRPGAAIPGDSNVRTVLNNTSLEVGAVRFVQALSTLHPRGENGADGRVAAVATRAGHSFSKDVVPVIRLEAGLGVTGDGHAGPTVQHRSRVAKNPDQPNLRQVHVLHEELFAELAAHGFTVTAGQLGENITTRGIDLLSLPTATRLRVGSKVVVEITGLRNPCSQLNGFQPGLLNAVLDRDAEGRLIRKAGVMGVVLTGGEVTPDDAIRVELPPPPHRPLEPV